MNCFKAILLSGILFAAMFLNSNFAFAQGYKERFCKEKDITVEIDDIILKLDNRSGWAIFAGDEDITKSQIYRGLDYHHCKLNHIEDAYKLETPFYSIYRYNKETYQKTFIHSYIDKISNIDEKYVTKISDEVTEYDESIFSEYLQLYSISNLDYFGNPILISCSHSHDRNHPSRCQSSYRHKSGLMHTYFIPLNKVPLEKFAEYDLEQQQKLENIIISQQK